MFVVLILLYALIVKVIKAEKKYTIVSESTLFIAWIRDKIPVKNNCSGTNLFEILVFTS